MIVRGTPGLGSQQDGVDRARGGVKILLVLDRVAGQDAGRDDQARRPLELHSLGRPTCLLEPAQRLRAQDAEPPGLGQVMVRRPARELQQLLQRPARHRIGPEGLVRTASADHLVHRRNVADPTSESPTRLIPGEISAL